jgi:hypothetical protein
MKGHKSNHSTEYHYIVDDLDADDSRMLLEIMTEFIDGFSLLSGAEPLVSIFGSAQADGDDRYVIMAEDLGKKLGRAGVSVITGGGPGIMEAANKGAHAQGGPSIGVAIKLPNEQPINKYMTQRMTLKHFFVRKVMLVKYSRAFVLFPGGFGTLDELFEALNLMRTERITPFPVIMMGEEFWTPLVVWLKNNVIARKYLDLGDLENVHLTDDVDEAVRICKESIIKFGDKLKDDWP